jgi:hypothetical protein
MGTLGSPPTRLTTVPDKWVRPTRRPVDLFVGPMDLVGNPHDLLKTFQVDSLDDLIRYDLKTWRTIQDKTSVDFAQSRSTGYGMMCNVDLGLLVVIDQESGNRLNPLANIRRMRQSLVTSPRPILKQSTPTTGRRVLLSGGPNQNKLIVFSVFRVLVCDLRVLSLRLLPTKQINHRD